MWRQCPAVSSNALDSARSASGAYKAGVLTSRAALYTSSSHIACPPLDQCSLADMFGRIITSIVIDVCICPTSSVPQHTLRRPATHFCATSKRGRNRWKRPSWLVSCIRRTCRKIHVLPQPHHIRFTSLTKDFQFWTLLLMDLQLRPDRASLCKISTYTCFSTAAL